jgi:hypothetical protein
VEPFDKDLVAAKSDRYERPLDLSEAATAMLVHLGPFGPETFSCTDPSDIEYGAPWREVAQMAQTLNEAIELAAAAGRLGFCSTGIALALRAAHLASVERCRGLAICAGAKELRSAADELRRFASIAEDLAADLGHREVLLQNAAWFDDLARAR